jgi:hypothetical protein
MKLLSEVFQSVKKATTIKKDKKQTNLPDGL